MEWKEHVAWLVPISITMAAAVFLNTAAACAAIRKLRNAVLSFTGLGFLAAGIAGFFGAMLSQTAPVGGGGTIHLMHGGEQ